MELTKLLDEVALLSEEAGLMFEDRFAIITLDNGHRIAPVVIDHDGMVELFPTRSGGWDRKVGEDGGAFFVEYLSHGQCCPDPHPEDPDCDDTQMWLRAERAGTFEGSIRLAAQILDSGRAEANLLSYFHSETGEHLLREHWGLEGAELELALALISDGWRQPLGELVDVVLALTPGSASP